MELKPRLKQTEVGAIPEDWGMRRLRTLLTQPATYGVVKAGTFRRHGIPMLRGGDIKDGRVNRELPYISPEKSAEYQRTVLRDGDVVIALVGYPGEAAVIPKALAGANISRAVGLLRLSELLAAGFLTCYLNSSRGRAEFLKPGAGSAQMVVNLRDLNLLWVPLPPTKTEQEAIAETLSDADALIESVEQLLAKKRQLKQGAMQEWLTGKKRLPGFSGKWSTVLLGELFTFKNGLNKAKQFFGYGTPIVNYMDVFNNPAIHSATLEGRVSLTARELNNFDVRKGDVLFTRTSETAAEIGMASVVLDETYQTVFSGFVLRARPRDNRLCDAFKAYCCRSEPVRTQIVAGASYTTRALTNGRLLSAVKLSLPGFEEQSAIAAILSDMDAEIAALESKLAKARAIKQGMMHELLTGRIRLI